MAQSGATREQLEAQVTQRAATDEQFRQELLNDPKQVLEQEMGVQLPDNITVQVIEETPTSFVLVLPPASPEAGQELSHSELDAVAGGWTSAADATMCEAALCQ